MTLALQDWMIPVGFVLFVGTFFAIAAYSAKQRREAIERELSSRGFRVTMKPTPDEKAAAFACICAYPGLRNGASGVNWFAQADAGGKTMTLAEHSYSTGSGKNRRMVYHTVAALPAPPAWPLLTLEPENFFHRLFEGLTGKDIRLEDPEFNKRWRVNCASEDFAILVLTPQVQQWCMSLDKGTSIAVGRGVLCVAQHRQLKAETLGKLAAQPAEMTALIPEEVWRFGAGRSGPVA